MKKARKIFFSMGLLVAVIAFLSFVPAFGITAAAGASGPEVAVGIDVSKYQGAINWQQVRAAGVRFAMIRVGTTKKGLDEQFANNINGANAAGVRTGVYIYSYATTPEAAAAEANQVLAWIAPYTVTFPVAIDIEDSCQKNLSWKVMFPSLEEYLLKRRRENRMTVLWYVYRENRLMYARLFRLLKWWKPWPRKSVLLYRISRYSKTNSVRAIQDVFSLNPVITGIWHRF